MRIAVLAFILCFVTGAHAQERVVLPAPPPAELPGYLDNDVTRRFVAWQQLERSWGGMRGEPHADGFARGAARVCTQAIGWPREGEPRPGLRATLIDQSCQSALSAVVTSSGLTVRENDGQTWQRGFVPGSDSESLDCLALDQLSQVMGELPTGKDPALLQRFQDARKRCTNQQRQAQRGRDALALPPCERISALNDLLALQGKLDWAARHLASADDAEVLESRWSRLAGRSARYAHVVAYHLSEARIELANFAERASTMPESADADEVRAAFSCLKDFRGAPARLREFERRIQDVRESAWSSEEPGEGTCCTVCSKGKACGNTCITRSKTCRVGPGCACDG